MSEGRDFAEVLHGVVASNIRDRRQLARLTQPELARRVNLLGFAWSRQTLSDIERGGRSVSVEELAGLALTLGVSVPALLDPAGVGGYRALTPPAASGHAPWPG